MTISEFEWLLIGFSCVIFGVTRYITEKRIKENGGDKIRKLIRSDHALLRTIVPAWVSVLDIAALAALAVGAILVGYSILSDVIRAARPM
jgi:hypothetical protein